MSTVTDEMKETRETTTVRLHRDAKATFDAWLEDLRQAGQPVPKREHVVSQLVTMLVELDDGTFGHLLMRTFNEQDRVILAQRVLERIVSAHGEAAHPSGEAKTVTGEPAGGLADCRLSGEDQPEPEDEPGIVRPRPTRGVSKLESRGE